MSSKLEQVTERWMSEQILINDIIVGERFRKSFSGIKDLAQNIKTHGVLQPIVVFIQGEGKDEKYHLIAGGRRLAACKHLGLEYIDARVVHEQLKEWQLREMELSENEQRVPLTWEEKDRLLATIHLLKQSENGEAKQGRGASEGGWRLEDTAKVTGHSKGAVSLAMRIHEADQLAPEARLYEKATQSEAAEEAKKLLEKQKAADKLNAVSTEVDSEKKSRTRMGVQGDGVESSDNGSERNEREYSRGEKNLGKSEQLSPADFINSFNTGKIKDFLAKIPDGHCDYIDMGMMQGSNIDAALFSEAGRILKDNGFATLVIRDEDHIVKQVIEKAFEIGGLGQGTPGYWYNKNLNSQDKQINLNQHFHKIMVMKKGNPQLASQRGNFFDIQHNENKTKRPDKLHEDMIKTFSNAGDTILSFDLETGMFLIKGFLNSRICFGFGTPTGKKEFEQFVQGMVKDE